MVDRSPLLVIGATGNQGGHVVRAFLERGFPVRALTRNSGQARALRLKSDGVAVFEGDLADADSLHPAFSDISGVFSVQNYWQLGMEAEIRLGLQVIAQAQHHGVPHFIYSSGWGANHLRQVAAIDGKAVLEERLRKSKLPYTILRPGLFMDDLLGASLPFSARLTRLLRPLGPLMGDLLLQILLSAAAPDQPIPLVALHDIGTATVWSWEHADQSRGQTWDLAGSYGPVPPLAEIWHRVSSRRIGKIPGLNAALRLVHPELAALIQWIASPESPSPQPPPFPLWPFETWAQRTAPPLL